MGEPNDPVESPEASSACELPRTLRRSGGEVVGRPLGRAGFRCGRERQLCSRRESPRLGRCSRMSLSARKRSIIALTCSGTSSCLEMSSPTVMPTSRSGLLARKRKDVGTTGQGSSGATAPGTLQRASAPTPFQAVTPRTTALATGSETVHIRSTIQFARSSSRLPMFWTYWRRTSSPLGPSSCSANELYSFTVSGSGSIGPGSTRTSARWHGGISGAELDEDHPAETVADDDRPADRDLCTEPRQVVGEVGDVYPASGASLRPQPRRSSAVTDAHRRSNRTGAGTPFGRSTSHERAATPDRRSRLARRSRASARRVLAYATPPSSM